ncbi:DUF2171 domain-containing protein [Sphingomonas xanthus]|uniref:DUF2171 domain-containing protein n=1 Tax=Sphingomonas xanthus TaxID=2594473 RepID=A0A516ISR5_9SPHN|nr:DUF2171 domain-containing protein [Sphingomonas xanthus]QDP19927.1 DUF2171 domain-containing protein [Sphingomonas xanthus]
MTYDRYESRRGWRDPRSRQDRYDRDDWRDERGFLDRAGDEIASWFGDDEAERRRRMDHRDDHPGAERNRYYTDRDREYGRGAFLSDDDFSRQDRSPKYRDEGYRRPYTGRFTGQRNYGSDDQYRSRAWSRSPNRDWDEERRSNFTGAASTGMHDPDYDEWRRRQIDALDRDYDEYRRENQSRFESEFSSWRDTRQTKRQMLSNVRENMEVVGSDNETVGRVDHVRGDRIVLTKDDSEDGRHHTLSCSLIDKVEGDRVILDKSAEEAKKQFSSEGRDRFLFENDRDREPGPHMLNRSFSGTY